MFLCCKYFDRGISQGIVSQTADINAPRQKISGNGYCTFVVAMIVVLVSELLFYQPIWAADIEAGAWAEIDIWIGLDDEQKNRIYILKSFTEQPKVANGASDMLVNIFGEAGRHVRAAVGAAALPMNAAVEVELVVEV